SDGSYIEVRRTPLPDGGSVQTFTDITKRREAEAYITRLASEDPLTQLPNRRVFHSALEALSSGRRHEADDASRATEFAVLFLDIDRFKGGKDTLGHPTGDVLLVEVARRLRALLGRSDILARLGGDEFAIVLPAVKSTAEIEALANNVIQAMSQPFEIDHHMIR